MERLNQLSFASAPARPSDALALWGHDPCDLHDALWAGLGVTVVRPGAPRPARERGATWLLLGPDELLALEDLAPVERLAARIRRPGPGRRASIVLDVHPSGEVGYAEEVLADDEDRLLAVRRHYDRRPDSIARVLVTRDARLARRWRALVHPARNARATAAADSLPGRRGRGVPRIEVPGLLESAGDKAGVIRWTTAILRVRPQAATLIDGVHERERHVYVHESSRIGPHVTLAGPLWIGANVVLDGNTSLVGPNLMLDQPAPFGRDDGPRRPARMVEPAPGADDPVAPSTAAAELEERIVHLPSSPPRTRPEHWTVRAFNVAVSAAVLLAIAPIVPFVMLAIWLEDGRPFFFGHERQTVGGRRFTCWKFRTMCRDAERMKAELEAENVCDGPQFHIADDPRLLRTGRLLRRFHLDELPQFWNVLRGEMNIVGPRPSPDDENQYCPAWREARLSVKPGLTGLWQINRTRAPHADFQEWIRWDLEYVTRRGWRLDLWIMLKTAQAMLLGRGGAEAAPAGHGPGALDARIRTIDELAVAVAGTEDAAEAGTRIRRMPLPEPASAEVVEAAVRAAEDRKAGTALEAKPRQPVRREPGEVLGRSTLEPKPEPNAPPTPLPDGAGDGDSRAA